MKHERRLSEVRKDVVKNTVFSPVDLGITHSTLYARTKEYCTKNDECLNVQQKISDLTDVQNSDSFQNKGIHFR